MIKLSSPRKLSVIMFTDIVGYTSLMGENEQFALQLLRENRKIHKNSLTNYRGKWVKEMGDGTLCSFQSALDAVACASELQELIKDIPKLKLRIGIHLGDVVFEGNDVFGDGVNIASRLQELGGEGDILISETVYSNIRNIEGIRVEFLKEEVLKNVKNPVKVYKITKGFSSDTVKYPKPKSTIRNSGIIIIMVISLMSILVIYKLFFSDNLINGNSISIMIFEDTDDGRIFSSISDEISAKLFEINDLKVIYQTHSRWRKSEVEMAIDQIGRDLNVSYVLLGHIHREKDQLMLSSQLFNTRTKQVLWSATLANLIDIPSDLISPLLEILELEVSGDEYRSILKKPTLNKKAYEIYLRGKQYYLRYTYADNSSAINLYRQALQLDPDFSLAHAGLSNAFMQEAVKSQGNSKVQWLDSAYRHALIVTQIDPENSSAHNSMGLYYSIQGDTKKGMEEFNRAISIDKNINAVIHLSRLYYRTDQIDKSLEILRNAEEYHPMEPGLLFNLGAIYYRIFEWEQANKYLEKALYVNPNHIKSLLLQWFVAVLSDDNETSFRVAQKLGFIGNDDFDKLLIVLERVIQRGMTDTTDPASILMDMLSGHELNYVELPYIYNLVAYIYFHGGHEERANSLLDDKLRINMDQISKGNLSYHLYYDLAQCYSILGENDKAFQYLEEAALLGWMEYQHLQIDPSFHNIKSDPRFQILLEQTINRVQVWKSIISKQEKLRTTL